MDCINIIQTNRVYFVRNVSFVNLQDSVKSGHIVLYLEVSVLFLLHGSRRTIRRMILTVQSVIINSIIYGDTRVRTKMARQVLFRLSKL